MGGNQKRLEEGLEMFKWTKTLSRLIGLWPLNPNYYLSDACILYMTVLLILEFFAIYKYLENVEKLIDLLVVSFGNTFIYTCILMLRMNNYQIGSVITQSITNYDISGFTDTHEVDVFMQFINRGRIILKVYVFGATAAEAIWFIAPIMSFSVDIVDENNKTLFLLPYEFYPPYEINSVKSYYLTYSFLIPSPFVIALGNSSMMCFVISLVFYISGKMAVLTLRINALKNDSYDCRNELKTLIAEHSRLLQMGIEVSDAFSVSLLVYFVSINFLICVLGYRLLIGIMTGRILECAQYVIYLGEVYLAMAVFCVISEYLTTESLKCGEAFYNSRWYALSIDKKDIILCIERSQRPLGLKAGKFTMFSLVTLTDVSKTAMGYFSLLRNFLMVD